jgi:signal transduction histidine kinase
MEEGRDSVMATALVLAVVVGCVAGVVVLLAAPGAVLAGPFRTGPGLEQAVLGGVLAAGTVLIGGTATLLVGSGRLIGWLAVLLGGAWIAMAGAGATLVTAVVPAIAFAATPLVGALLFALAVAVGDARRRRWAVRATVVVVALGLGLVLVRFASYDPFFDLLGCVGCGRADPILDLSPSIRLALSRLADAGTLVAGAATIVVAAEALVSRRFWTPARLTVDAGCLLAGAGLAGASTLALLGSLTVAAAQVLRFLQVVGLAMLGIGLVWSVVEVLVLRARLGRMAAEMASAGDGFTVERGLATALGERFIGVGYRMPDGSGDIRDDGEPFARPTPGSDLLDTTIDRHGRAVAIIRHRASLDPAAVRAEMTPTMLVAVDNERLRAVSLATLRALRDSRARIVAIEDEERRRVERDLHDGAQQRLLAIAFELRLARTDALRAADRVAVDRLTQAEGLAFVALDELRRLARGVHPAILSQSGLAPALSSLAEDSPVAMTLVVDRALRLPPLIEATAYQVVAEVLTDAAAAGSTEVAVAVVRESSVVTLDIEMDGRGPEPWPIRIADRVGAAGGDVSLDHPSADRTRIHVIMPCA